MWCALAVILLALGLVLLVYSHWFQDSLRQSIVRKICSEPGVVLRLGRFELDFPLNLDIADILLVQNGDTLIAVSYTHLTLPTT